MKTSKTWLGFKLYNNYESKTVGSWFHFSEEGKVSLFVQIHFHREHDKTTYFAEYTRTISSRGTKSTISVREMGPSERGVRRRAEKSLRNFGLL